MQAVTKSDARHAMKARAVAEPRPEIGVTPDTLPHSWWRRLRDGNDPPADYVKTHGRTAFDVMTRKVTCVLETTPLAEIVSVFERKPFRRLPVLHEDQRVGIVCRSDLVRALVAEPPADRRHVFAQRRRTTRAP